MTAPTPPTSASGSGSGSGSGSHSASAAAPAPGSVAAAPLAIAADGSYAARLVAVAGADSGGGGWCPERWTLDGPEPYAVRLPGQQPEDPDSPVLPLPDGRVLIGRRAGHRHHFSLLYPSGPDTGELPLGAVAGERVTLLPPTPDGSRVYALASDPDGGPHTSLWLVCGGTAQPELVARLDGRCAGGAWLDQAGGLLALNRTDAAGQTRAIAVPVAEAEGGPASELLRIADDSNDRLLLADPDSGLLLVSSDAPGRERIGWGVLGSHRPVRFPEALNVPEAPPMVVTPFAMQPGQVLLPESCAVALRMTTAEADWVAVWRPQQRELQHLAAPAGWLAGSGRWTPGGELLLPYSTPQVPCGLARMAVPVPEPQPLAPARDPRESKDTDADADAGEAREAREARGAKETVDTAAAAETTAAGAGEASEAGEGDSGSGDARQQAETAAPAAAPAESPKPAEPAPPAPAPAPAPGTSPGGAAKPVPLQQAPL